MSTEPSKDHDCKPKPDVPEWARDLPQWAIDHWLRSQAPRYVQFWSPPEDPDKPALPYLPGFNATIHRHDIAGTEPRPYLSEEYMKTVTQSESVVANPPVEPSSSATLADAQETAQLTVTAPIAIEAERGPQIVACTVTPCQQDGTETSRPFQAAAKIYDPLYYSFKKDIGDHPRDCVYAADKAYRVETAAYEHLRTSGQCGSFAPIYYGSWTFALPITIHGKPQTRNVRLVLMELFNAASIQGTRRQNNPDRSMGTDSFHYPEEYRLEVLARAMDGYTKQLNTGLIQNDFAGRNVILVTDTSGDSHGDMVCGLAMPRIVLIDYNIAEINELRPEQVAGPPDNPAVVFWQEYLWHDFPGWVPNEWADGKFQHEWLLRRFVADDDQRQLYYPVPEELSEKLTALATRTTADSGQQPNASNHENRPDPLAVEFGTGPGQFMDFRKRQELISELLKKLPEENK